VTAAEISDDDEEEPSPFHPSAGMDDMAPEHAREERDHGEEDYEEEEHGEQDFEEEAPDHDDEGNPKRSRHT
jgi:hypothetical protein